ncbi:amino acid permease [Peribacillus sp. B-H-3]|uniref:amino acid permease n=1 Tax=Peribacillus sp. B-H-3 TaxID=3400420 RepID=UPI003B017A72
MKKHEQVLNRGLLSRHVQLIALAGMIGTGIFKGSSDTLNLAGPSVIIAYLIGGLLLFIVMAALGEMAMVFPDMNVQKLIHHAFGSQVSFIAGWLYWINWIIVTIVELLAAGSFLQYWFPSLPLWLLALLCGALIIGINLTSVKNYGEFEFWFAGIKIIALIAFIILGACILFGLFPGSPDHPFTNYTAHGGFFPHGANGILSAFLVVVFSYGGAELIGVAVTETKDAQRVLPKIIKGTVWRVILFYVLPILIICGIMPWDKVSSAGSPFVQVFSTSGLPGAAGIMNFVLLTAVLSAANSGVYATSRTLFSLSQTGEAPRFLSRTTKSSVPVFGISLTGLFIGAGVFLAYLAPEQIISYMMTIPGFTVLLLWIAICAAQLKLRSEYPEMPSFKVLWHPLPSIFAILSLSFIFCSFILSSQNAIGTFVCLIILFVLTFASFIIKHRNRA